MKKPEDLRRSGLGVGRETNQLEAQQVAGFGTSAAHLWVAKVCLALLSPTTVNLDSQAVQVCFATFWVAVPASTWPPLAWRFTSVTRTSAHFRQGMAGTTATAGVVATSRSFSIWRTFGEAAMGLNWALAVLANARAASATAARAIFGERFVFIFGTFFQIVSLFGELFSFDTLNTLAGGKSL